MYLLWLIVWISLLITAPKNLDNSMDVIVWAMCSFGAVILAAAAQIAQAIRGKK